MWAADFKDRFYHMIDQELSRVKIIQPAETFQKALPYSMLAICPRGHHKMHYKALVKSLLLPLQSFF